MPSFTIPLTTLQIGVVEFGPMVVNNADNLIHLAIDRTVAGGFNNSPASTVMLLYIWYSTDNGNPYTWIAGDQINGGIYTNTRTGLVDVTDYVEVDLIAGPQRRAKAIVTVFGAAVTVAGSLVTS